MEIKEEVTDPVPRNFIFIKTENEEPRESEEYLFEDRIKQIKEEPVNPDEFKVEILNEEYDIPEIKTEYDDFTSAHMEATTSGENIPRSGKKSTKKKKKRKKRYSCPVCQKKYATSFKRKSHFFLHFNKNYVICIFCGKMFTQTGLYMLHFYSHCLKIRKRVKTKCDIKFMEERDGAHTFYKHDRFEIESSILFKCLTKKEIYIKEKPFKYELCSRKITENDRLKAHEYVDAQEKIFYCQICSKHFTNMTDLKTHICIDARNEAGKDTVFSNSSTCINGLEKHVYAEKSQFKCKVCSENFARRQCLERHMLIHKLKRPFTCEVCSKTFIHRGSFNQHTRIHSGEKPFTCDICSKTFTRKSNLNQHLRRHTTPNTTPNTTPKPFKCEVCSRLFRASDALKTHMRCHRREKSVFKCEVCSKRFIYRGYLNRHVRGHSGKKMFSCKICSKTFTGMSYLNNHFRHHIGGKRFKRVHKPYKYKKKMQLSRRTKVKPFKCVVCSKLYSYYKNLTNHMLIHNPDEFDVCSRKFTESESLNVHAHAGENPYCKM